MDVNKIDFPLLIDGGLSNELESMGCDISDELWTARMIEANPEAIIDTHVAYLEAGAGCITTSSYQATIPGLMNVGFDSQAAEDLILSSAILAQKARSRFITSHPQSEQPLIAGSIGPYGAYLADGSEYRGNYGLTDKDLLDFHKPRISILDDSEIDLYACETIPSFQEVKVLGEILREMEKPAWISCSCKDGHSA